MNKRVLAIYDLNTEYANVLMEYITEKKNMPFETITFTKKEELLTYLKKEKINLLLIAAEVMDDDIERQKIDKIILLSSGNIPSKYKEHLSVYKYQSTENIVRQVLEHFADAGEGRVIIRKEKSEIMGVYSPVGRTGKTSFALTLGQVLASDYTTLYLNFEEFSAFHQIFHRDYSGDLSDVMYFFKQNPEALPVKLQAIVHEIHGMDYVPPLTYSRDLRNIPASEWVSLIEQIKYCTSYKKIVLDLSNMISDIFQMLEECDVIYMPVIEDMVSEMKISSYEEYLLKTGKEDILNKTIKLSIPNYEEMQEKENYFEQQLWGAMGDCVRAGIRQFQAGELAKE